MKDTVKKGDLFFIDMDDGTFQVSLKYYRGFDALGVIAKVQKRGFWVWKQTPETVVYSDELEYIVQFIRKLEEEENRQTP